MRSDSLFRVKRRSGARQLVLIHGEVQTTRDAELAERMFRYNYRSFEAQGLEVVIRAWLPQADLGDLQDSDPKTETPKVSMELELECRLLLPPVRRWIEGRGVSG